MEPREAHLVVLAEGSVRGVEGWVPAQAPVLQDGTQSLQSCDYHTDSLLGSLVAEIA